MRLAGVFQQYGDREEIDIVSIHRYRPASLMLDGLRCTFGLAATIGPLAFLDVVWPLAMIMFALGLVFSAFAVRLALQYQTSIEVSDRGIASRGLVVRRIAWEDLTSLRLAHYAPPKRPSEGWYQLMIRGQNSAVKVDSTIEDFGEIMRRAVVAADAAGLVLDPATSENLRGVGHFRDQMPIAG